MPIKQDIFNNITLIAGATASGKSGYAMARAADFESNGTPCVIINADALQIYDALPILTAQPPVKDRMAIPHALYGILPANAPCSVAIWLDHAVLAIRAAWETGRHPIVVGGTGMYLRALIEGLSPLPEIPNQIRTATRAHQAKLGNPAFHTELARLDPVMAARLRPSDTHRLIRAYEVIMTTGKSLATWQDEKPILPLPEAHFHRILLDGPRAVLRTRADMRLHAMLKEGVLKEVNAFANLIKAGDVAADAPPLRALGYTPFLAAAREEMTIADAITAAKIETGQYIKRQQTWLRHQMIFDETFYLSTNS